MKKIFFVANTGFFLYNYLLGVMRSFKKENFEIVVVAPKDEYTDMLIIEGFRFVLIKELDRKGANIFNDIRLMIELYNIFRKEKPFLTLNFTIKINVFGTFAAKLAKVNSICTVSGLGWLFTEKSIKTVIGGFLYKILYKIAFSIALNIVFQNIYDMEFFIKNKLVDKNKSYLTPGPGVDTDYFSPECCSTKNYQSDKHVFLLLARMLWDKGIGELVSAAREAKKIYSMTEFWLVGPLDKENRAAIPEETIRGWEEEEIIKYFGKTNDARSFLCNCDVAVLPSYREGIASSLIEAMALGKPVITTDAIGCRDVVEDGKNGFLVPVKDDKALAEAIIKYILLSPEEKKLMGEYSREKALKKFDKKIVTNVYKKIINDVMAQVK